MHTHRGIANTIRRTTRLPAPNGMHDVSNLLNQALDYMEVASSNLTDLTGKLVTVRGVSVAVQSNQMSIELKHIQRSGRTISNCVQGIVSYAGKP